MKSITLRKWHRRISIVVALYVMMATVSGIVHIVLANFFTPPSPVIPQGMVDLEQAALPLSEIVKKLPADQKSVKAISLRTVQGKLYYQILAEGAKVPVYVLAKDASFAEIDKTYAAQIAASYLKSAQPLQQTDYLTAFNSEYMNIFRVLPVYRFDNLQTGERVYVSTNTGSVTHYLSKARALGQYSFSYLHKLMFIPNKRVRDLLQLALILGIIFTTIMGVVMFVRQRRLK